MHSHVLQRFGYTRNDWVCIRHNFLANNVPSNYPQQSKKEGQWAELTRRDRIIFRRIFCTFLTTCLPNSRLTSLQTFIMATNRIFCLVSMNFLLFSWYSTDERLDMYAICLVLCCGKMFFNWSQVGWLESWSLKNII